MSGLLFNQEIKCLQEEDLMEVARQFSSHLKHGDICLLYGEMGAGKTFFTREVYLALGGSEHVFASPTYNLVHQYPMGELYFYHVDLYRIRSLADQDDLMQEEWLDPHPGFSFIEWPERMDEGFKAKGWKIELSHAQEGRLIKIQSL